MKTRSITQSLFLAILAASILVAVGMGLIMRWSIDRGFLHYVNTVEASHLKRLAGVFEQAYGENGSWEFMRDDPRERLQLFREASPPPPRHRLRGRGPASPGLQPRSRPFSERRPPRGAGGAGRPFIMRVILLDAGHHRVFGPPQVPGNLVLRPLAVNGEVVGYLGLLPLQHLFDAYQLRFLKEQKLVLILVAGLLVLAAALLSLPLARRLVRPLKELAAATHRLAAGDHAVRVPVTSADELGRLAGDFNTLALTLEKNERARRRWVADISHELRTPLAVLQGEVEALQDGVRPVTAEALGSLHGEVLQLGRLVEDLYQLARSDLGTLTYRKETIDLTEVLGDCLEGFSAAFAQNELTVVCDLGPSPTPVFADPARLQQLFDNLLQNAFCYTDAGGRLEVRLATGSGRASVELRDSAPGVPPTELGKLFDRLYRVESSRNRATGGAGLGLAICKNIVEAHDGTIGASPSSLGGLRIRIDLPLAGEAL